jgi:hypothetical protein
VQVRTQPALVTGTHSHVLGPVPLSTVSCVNNEDTPPNSASAAQCRGWQVVRPVLSDVHAPATDPSPFINAEIGTAARASRIGSKPNSSHTSPACAASESSHSASYWRIFSPVTDSTRGAEVGTR